MGSTNFENGISQNFLAQIKNSLLYDPLYAQPMPPTTVSYPQPPSLYVVIFDWCVNRMGQNGHNFVRDMSLLESQSKGCVNPTFNPAHKWIFAMYLLGCICTVGARARAHPKFWDLCSCKPPFQMPLLTVCPPYIWFLATALICSSKGMNFIRDYRIGWIGLALVFAHLVFKKSGA